MHTLAETGTAGAPAVALVAAPQSRLHPGVAVKPPHPIALFIQEQESVLPTLWSACAVLATSSHNTSMMLMIQCRCRVGDDGPHSCPGSSPATAPPSDPVPQVLSSGGGAGREAVHNYVVAANRHLTQDFATTLQ